MLDMATWKLLLIQHSVRDCFVPYCRQFSLQDVSGMPTIGLPVEWGGFGFDYRCLEDAELKFFAVFGMVGR